MGLVEWRRASINERFAPRVDMVVDIFRFDGLIAYGASNHSGSLMYSSCVGRMFHNQTFMSSFEERETIIWGAAWVALDRDGPTLERPGPESPGKPGPAGLYTTGVTQFTPG